ncbi:MAG: flagellar biosynthesis protein [Clostridia bacterium]|nr:flagellar biosynthesis protein [Clostridia bacterium]
MVVNNRYLNNINRIVSERTVQTGQKTINQQDDFDKILKSKINENTGLKFSKHAELRLKARNINLTENQKEKINEAVSRAEGKGVKESLVLMDNLAFVVNVKNKTVITAVSSNELKDNVFTNIDGAVFA